ncbi:MAG: carboxypeptidase-like regulatory domain-containing protein [Bacteroidetes bacterium]|nr:MAG: carboxypeptidase-like regulatory domain-containing protein [Bacteroidota bacterium]
MTRIFLFFLCFLFLQNSFSQQFYIRGRVLDIDTQLPLKGASVYINNTTKGSTTNDNGDFELGPLQPGRYEIVASFVGYDPLLYSAEIKSSNLRISFKVEKKEEVLREVLVLSSELRKHYLEIFKKYVIGQTIAADRCQIKNIEEVQFASGETKDEIVAYTEKALVIENPELGYTIHFDLLEFYYNKATNGAYFFGYTRFVDWGKDEKTKKKWIRKRREAYEGSTVHFFRSLVNKQLAKEGFTVYQLINMPERKERVGMTITIEKSSEKMQMASKAIEDSMIRIYPDSVYRIYELRVNDGWRIMYSKNTDLKTEMMRKSFISGQPSTGTVSGLRLREEPVLVNARGIILTPIRLFYDGIWGYERLANMLPEDYEVE